MQSEIIKEFCDYIAIVKDEEGIYPSPLITCFHNGKKEIAALALESDQTIAEAIKHTRNLSPREHLGFCEELVFGIDRFTKENQGTTLANVLTCAYWNKDGWVPFVIEYDDDQILPPNWNNEFWNKIINDEIKIIERKFFLRVVQGPIV